MIFPPLQRSLLSNIGDRKNQVDHVWYGFFRSVYETLFGAIGDASNSTTTGLSGKLNTSQTGGSTGWDDLRAPATAVNPAGIAAAPAYDENNVGYNFDSTLDRRIDVIFQLPHGWKKGTNILPHIHVKPLANSNGNIVWQLHTSWANSRGTQPAFTITNSNMVVTTNIGNVILKEVLFGLGNSVPNTLSNESSIVKYKLYRLGASDSYTGDVLFDEFDCHYQAEKAGTPDEYPT